MSDPWWDNGIVRGSVARGLRELADRVERNTVLHPVAKFHVDFTAPSLDEVGEPIMGGLLAVREACVSVDLSDAWTGGRELARECS